MEGEIQVGLTNVNESEYPQVMHGLNLKEGTAVKKQHLAGEEGETTSYSGVVLEKGQIVKMKLEAG